MQGTIYTWGRGQGAGYMYVLREGEGGHLSLVSCKGRYCRFSLAEIPASPSLVLLTLATDLYPDMSSSSRSPDTQLHTKLINAMKAVLIGCVIKGCVIRGLVRRVC